MPFPNRVDPSGDLHATPARGTLTGNRGCLVDESGRFVRRQQVRAWIYCRLRWGEARHPLAQPRTWTPLFFLDVPTALAAGHRPCGFCHRQQLASYKSIVGLSASAIDRQLADERRLPIDQKPTSSIDDLPDETVVLWQGSAHLLAGGRLSKFSFSGWESSFDIDRGISFPVLTPMLTVSALRAGLSLMEPR